MGWVGPMEFVIVADVELGWMWGRDRQIIRVFMYLLVTVSALWGPKMTVHSPCHSFIGYDLVIFSPL